MFQKVYFAVVLMAVGFGGLWNGLRGSEQRSRPTVETILFNGKIVTVGRSFSYAQALAIFDGKVVSVGTDKEILQLAGPTTQKMDLRGKTVVPGFADDHFHWAGGGPGVDLSRVRSLGELLKAIAGRVKRSKPGELIITNNDWHEAQLKEQRLPSRWDLDKVAPNNPVVVVRGGHEYILNSAALKKWNITTETPVPAGGRLSRYEDGELNGELVDTAKSLVQLPPPPDKDMEARIQDQLEEFRKINTAGVTSIRIPGAPIEQYRLLQEIKRRGLLNTRVTFLIGFYDRRFNSPEDLARLLTSLGVGPEEGDAWLRIGGIKLGVDGGFEGGWMREPYAEPWGQGGGFFGLQTVDQETYTGLVKLLSRLNWRVATHAVGDRAIDQVLAGYEAANREKSIVGRRWAIEHAFMVRPDHVPKIKELGIVVSAQNHLYVAGPSLEKYWGRKRAEWVTPVRTLLDNKIMVGGGTDAPVIPYPPLWVIYHFVTRDTISGGVFGKAQRISREEALRLVTINNAYLSFEENIKGSLEPGKFADLVVLSGDILTCAEEQIPNLSILMTMVNGQIVFKDKNALF